jgi:putative ABC transport system substrate-binding protein
MAELGYVEGENIVYEYLEVPQTATPEEAQAVAQKFVDDEVDMIFAYPTPPTVAAHAVTQGTDIPVVFAMSSLEGLGLIESVSEPGGTMTGVRYPGPEMISKRLEILIEIAPQVKRVWIGYDKNHPNTAPALEVLRPAASSLGVTLVEVPAATLEELEADLAARAASADLGLDAIVTLNDGFNQGPVGFALLSGFTAEHKVPLGGGSLSTVQQGAVFGNSPDLIGVGELAAPLADKIFKGTPAGTIPVVTPEQDLYINYKVAQELGLTVPEGLLNQATQIIR